MMEVYVVLEYDYEGYDVKGICTDVSEITENMLDGGLLDTKVVKVKLNEVITVNLLDLDPVDLEN